MPTLNYNKQNRGELGALPLAQGNVGLKVLQEMAQECREE